MTHRFLSCASARRVLMLGAAMVAACALLSVCSARAEALCSRSPETGTWVNADASTRGISRIELEPCVPLTTCRPDGVCRTITDAGWAMHVWGRCHPIDCDWGWVTASRTGWGILGRYDHGWATRFVLAAVLPSRPGRLVVRAYTDFASRARADYARTDVFVPAR